MAQYYEGIGRRKESTARVRLMTGSGKFTVNEKEGGAFFTRTGDMEDILRPFGAVGQEAVKYDVSVLVSGGGVTGQTEAVRLGVARALQIINADWTSALRKKACSPAMPASRNARSPVSRKPARLRPTPSVNPLTFKSLG
jgi:small subunit ribosomal protein S9